MSLKDDISKTGDIIVAGADMIFSVFDSSGLNFNTNDHTSAYGGIYLGKVTSNNGPGKFGEVDDSVKELAKKMRSITA